MKQHNYFIYIVTNHAKTVLYIGVTNDIARRLNEHFENRGKPSTFAGRYHCYNLIYYERFSHIDHAIVREKELKDWNREKKEALISSLFPIGIFLMMRSIEYPAHLVVIPSPRGGIFSSGAGKMSPRGAAT